MIKSMTAFGSGAVQQGDRRCLVEIRSVNHRYRDIVVRLPRNQQVFEEGFRAIISSRISRGRVEASFQMEMGQDAASYDLELNLPLADAYLKAFRQLADHAGLDQEMRLETLIQMKDILAVKPEPEDVNDLREGFDAALSMALDALDEMRIKEGNAILDDFVKRLDRLEGFVDAVHTRAPQLPEIYRKRLTEKVGELLNGMEVDPARLAQEVGFLAERSDITEEIIRIRSHLNQFREYLSIDDPVGRRLDFLIQEMNREISTIGAKSEDATVSHYVVEIKNELEKIREQAQNIL